LSRLYTITRITELALNMGAQGSTSRHGDSEQSRSVCAKAFTCCSAIQTIYDVDDDASSHTAQRSVFVGVWVNFNDILLLSSKLPLALRAPLPRPRMCSCECLCV
jgi:hypothetical protein